MSKELCKCGKLATYLYMPSSTSDERPYYCDECVPRGCECNYEHVSEPYYELPTGEEGKDWKWLDKGKMWTGLDDGKEYPCCEYDYEKEGYDIELCYCGAPVDKTNPDCVQFKLCAGHSQDA